MPEVETVLVGLVLILVVMEEGQRQYEDKRIDFEPSLNPCCNGRGSKTLKYQSYEKD